MKSPAKVLEVRFYKTDAGRMPVQEWLKGLSWADKKTIGEDLKTVEFGWPLGIPVVRKMEKDLWEVRSELTSNRVARILFTVHEASIVLLHGFIKKSKKIPTSHLKLAKQRMKKFSKGEKP